MPYEHTRLLINRVITYIITRQHNNTCVSVRGTICEYIKGETNLIKNNCGGWKATPAVRNWKAKACMLHNLAITVTSTSTRDLEK